MPEWEPVIGLEIHVQLKTRTKMFCRCENVWGEEPNTRTCPVCLAHPGTLPVPNRKAIEWTVKLGLALDCEIASRALFHRKNYFYPDLPKGYQISQYDVPLASGGRFAVPGPTATARSGSCARTSRRTPRRRSTSAAPAGASTGPNTRSSTSTEAARRLSRSCRSPMCARARRRGGSCSSCARRSSSSASRTPRWRRARSAATPTCPCARWGRPASAQRPSSRT